MTQNAVVLNTFPDGTALVAVARGTACGSNCANCESCAYQNEMKVTAENVAGAQQGQKVEISSRSSEIYKAVAWVYILPVLLLFAGYFIALALGAAEGGCILSAFAGVAAGAVLLVLTQRKKPPIRFTIERVLDSREG